MKVFAIAGRRGATLLLAGLVVCGLAACESGPDLARLAPTMPNLNPEVPETAHPDAPPPKFPNINEVPDRPSVMHSKEQLQEIEKSLEAEGDRHVKDAITQITGEEPGNGKKGKAAGQRKPDAPSDDAGGTSDDTPLPLTPPPSDQPS